MLRALFFAPILFLLVLFALSNPQTVQLGLWPTDVTIGLPLSIAVLIAMAVSFVVGALMLWISVLGARLRARRAEADARALRGEIEELEARLSRAMATPVQPPTITINDGAALAAPART